MPGGRLGRNATWDLRAGQTHRGLRLPRRSFPGLLDGPRPLAPLSGLSDALSRGLDFPGERRTCPALACFASFLWLCSSLGREGGSGSAQEEDPAIREGTLQQRLGTG